MRILIFLITFMIYHFILYSYSEVVFSPKDNKWRFRVLTGCINVIVFGLYYVFSFHESILLLVYALLLTTELYFGYQRSRLKCVFATLCFATNFFAVRLAIMSIYSICTKQTFGSIVMNIDTNVYCTIASFIFCSFYIILFRYTLTSHYMHVIQSSQSNVRFATKVLFCIYVFQIFNTINGYVTEEYALLPWLQLKIAICVIVGFCAALVYAYLLSRLNNLKDVSKVMEEQIVVQQKESKQLENMAYIDQGLDCYSRLYGLNYLENMLQLDQECFTVIYFDLDGLKAVNDKYGHLEGDMYIENIVDILKTVFCNQMVCRMGGDEFMVVTNDINEYDAYKLAINVCNSIEDRNMKSKLPYHMSVSYGVLEINKKSRVTSAKILKTVDEKMYLFKRSRKKARFM